VINDQMDEPQNHESKGDQNESTHLSRTGASHPKPEPTVAEHRFPTVGER